MRPQETINLKFYKVNKDDPLRWIKIWSWRTKKSKLLARFVFFFLSHSLFFKKKWQVLLVSNLLQTKLKQKPKNQSFLSSPLFSSTVSATKQATPTKEKEKRKKPHQDRTKKKQRQQEEDHVRPQQPVCREADASSRNVMTWSSQEELRNPDKEDGDGSEKQSMWKRKRNTFLVFFVWFWFSKLFFICGEENKERSKVVHVWLTCKQHNKTTTVLLLFKHFAYQNQLFCLLPFWLNLYMFLTVFKQVS